MLGLGELETVIMELMWRRHEPATVREVHEHLSGIRTLAYNTVLTVMDNLHTKGFLVRHKVRRAWLYAPTLSKEEHVADLVLHAIGECPDQDSALAELVARMSHAQSQTMRWLLRRRGGRSLSKP